MREKKNRAQNFSRSKIKMTMSNINTLTSEVLYIIYTYNYPIRKKKKERKENCQ